MVKRGIRIYYFLHSFSCHTCTFCLSFYHFTFWLVAWVCFLWGNRFCICLCSVIVFANYFTSPPLLYYYYYYLKKKQRNIFPMLYTCVWFSLISCRESFLCFWSLFSVPFSVLFHYHTCICTCNLLANIFGSVMVVRMVVRVKLSNFTQTGTCN